MPAVYGITGDPYLVFVTNAFALLGLRALYFVLEGALSALVHLSYGLAAILGFIGFKLVLHWAHLVWPSVPDVPTLVSLFVILGILAVTVTTSLVANKRRRRASPSRSAESTPALPGGVRQHQRRTPPGVRSRSRSTTASRSPNPAQVRAKSRARYSTTSTRSP